MVGGGLVGGVVGGAVVGGVVVNGGVVVVPPVGGVVVPVGPTPRAISHTQTASVAILENCCGCGAAPGALALPAGLSHPVGPLQPDPRNLGIRTHKLFIRRLSRLLRDGLRANDPRLGRCGLSFDASGIFFPGGEKGGGIGVEIIGR